MSLQPEMVAEVLDSVRTANAKRYRIQIEHLESENTEAEARVHMDAIRRLAGSRLIDGGQEANLLRLIISVAENRLGELC